ncbi:hypothetical protein VTJ04DRAFT_8096 [Mycothermus thermophilus]|uniref:uncharacterized protein n=1 Tax=Humicola insolens TaxID=85995 RepID=UPI003742E3F2
MRDRPRCDSFTHCGEPDLSGASRSSLLNGASSFKSSMLMNPSASPAVVFSFRDVCLDFRIRIRLRRLRRRHPHGRRKWSTENTCR